ncbi:uncharacterized protein LOC117096508 [Trachypithecus francoisi]|uniref:uncharacterized protein LOC117096508 n=1 Tax=Trachypithecus francoisi TaxID=54180 RepID=UPI00141B6B7C|nr:uncharacterized protein LOC117096508 [Trachypithecus francoisi]
MNLLERLLGSVLSTGQRRGWQQRSRSREPRSPESWAEERPRPRGIRGPSPGLSEHQPRQPPGLLAPEPERPRGSPAPPPSPYFFSCSRCRYRFCCRCRYCFCSRLRQQSRQPHLRVEAPGPPEMLTPPAIEATPEGTLRPADGRLRFLNGCVPLSHQVAGHMYGKDKVGILQHPDGTVEKQDHLQGAQERWNSIIRFMLLTVLMLRKYLPKYYGI